MHFDTNAVDAFMGIIIHESPGGPHPQGFVELSPSKKWQSSRRCVDGTIELLVIRVNIDGLGNGIQFMSDSSFHLSG
jgi:hypothetical protein